MAMFNHPMHIACLDLEGILVPEVWINVAEHTGIAELRLTTRDISDYDVLMKRRIQLLWQNGLKLADIQAVIRKMAPLDGAYGFVQALRRAAQVIVLSDTFVQFAQPLMEMLDWPTLFCNTLIVDGSGMVKDYVLRQPDGKCRAVAALKSLGFTTLAVGDSYNDIGMLEEADHPYLFRPPAQIVEQYPHFPAVHDHDELLELLRGQFEQG